MLGQNQLFSNFLWPLLAISIEAAIISGVVSFPYMMFPMKLVQQGLTTARLMQLDEPVYLKGQQVKNIKLAVFQYEAKYQHVEPTIGKYLYHATLKQKEEKIKKFGLQPKSASVEFDYKARVYLYNTDDMRVIEQYARESKKHGHENDEQILLQIDPDKVPHLKLYVDTAQVNTDPKHPTAVFTYQAIPSSAITKIKDFEI